MTTSTIKMTRGTAIQFAGSQRGTVTAFRGDKVFVRWQGGGQWYAQSDFLPAKRDSTSASQAWRIKTPAERTA